MSEVTSKYEVEPKTFLISETQPTISTRKRCYTDIVNAIQLNQVSEKKIKEQNKKSTVNKSKETKTEQEGEDIEGAFNGI